MIVKKLIINGEEQDIPVTSVNGQTGDVTVSSGLKVAFIERTPNDGGYWELQDGTLGDDTICVFTNTANVEKSINGYIYDDQGVEILEISSVLPDLASLDAGPGEIGTGLLKNINDSWVFFPRQGFIEHK